LDANYFSVGGHRLTGMADPHEKQDAVNLRPLQASEAYILQEAAEATDTKISKTNPTVLGDLNVTGNQKIENLGKVTHDSRTGLKSRGARGNFHWRPPMTYFMSSSVVKFMFSLIRNVLVRFSSNRLCACRINSIDSRLGL